MIPLAFLLSAAMVVIMVFAAVQNLRNRRRGADAFPPGETATPGGETARESGIEGVAPGPGGQADGSELDGAPDPEGAFELLGKFSHAHEAELARSALEAAGIEAAVQHGHGGLVGYGTWVTVWVPAGAGDAAREALAEESRALELTPEEQAEEAQYARRRKVSRGASYLLLYAVFCVMLGAVVGVAFWPAPLFALYLFEALLFAGLYLWARWDPYPALLTGVVLFALGQAAGFLMGMPRILGSIGVIPVGYLVWTGVFLAAWIVAIREARPRVNESARS